MFVRAHVHILSHTYNTSPIDILEPLSRPSTYFQDTGGRGAERIAELVSQLKGLKLVSERGHYDLTNHPRDLESGSSRYDLLVGACYCYCYYYYYYYWHYRGPKRTYCGEPGYRPKSREGHPVAYPARKKPSQQTMFGEQKAQQPMWQESTSGAHSETLPSAAFAPLLGAPPDPMIWAPAPTAYGLPWL
jgi:hypothetical protein